MDWVMIHFHKDRMKRINEVIRELWRSIYRGNDIDWIEIKTEEGATTATGTFSYLSDFICYLRVRVKRGDF